MSVLKKKVPVVLAFRAVEILFRATYDLRDGHRVCLICGAMQYDYSKGHGPDCPIPDALQMATDLLDRWGKEV